MPPIAWQLSGQLAAGKAASEGWPTSTTPALAGAAANRATARAEQHVMTVAMRRTTWHSTRLGGRCCGYLSRCMDSFEQFARAGVELAGLEMDDVDLKVMRAAH